MSAYRLKQLVVWLVAMGLGFITTYLIITVGFDLLPLISSIETPQGVSIETYGYLYFFFTMLPIGLVFVIILDGVTDAGILPD